MRLYKIAHGARFLQNGPLRNPKTATELKPDYRGLDGSRPRPVCSTTRGSCSASWSGVPEHVPAPPACRLRGRGADRAGDDCGRRVLVRTVLRNGGSKPSQRTLNQKLTVALALFGQIDDVLRKRLASAIGIPVHLECGFVGLYQLPRIVQRTA
jgi:hypothetical protein